jgi:hypothetical protein
MTLSDVSSDLTEIEEIISKLSQKKRESKRLRSCTKRYCQDAENKRIKKKTHTRALRSEKCNPTTRRAAKKMEKHKPITATKPHDQKLFTSYSQMPNLPDGELIIQDIIHAEFLRDASSISLENYDHDFDLPLPTNSCLLSTFPPLFRESSLSCLRKELIWPDPILSV